MKGYRPKKAYYFAGNRNEGCGHRHRNINGAALCLARLTKRGLKRGHVLYVGLDNKSTRMDAPGQPLGDR